MRSHGVVLHASPWVVLGGGLGVPHITGVSPQLARFQSVHDSLGLTDLTTGGVDQVAALLEVANHLGVEQVLCALQAKPNWLRTPNMYRCIVGILGSSCVAFRRVKTGCYNVTM